VITHEMSVVSYLCNKVAVMEHGKVVESGDVYSVFAEPSQQVTRRFIGAALHDRPRPDVVARLRERHPGRIVTIAVRESEATEGVIITERLRAHGIDGHVVFGGITEVNSRPLGSLTFALEGPDAAVDAFVADLRAHTEVVEHTVHGDQAGPATEVVDA
jgi:D-methionine transport system ATP-binding protein